MAESPFPDSANANKRRNFRRLLAFFLALLVLAVAAGGWWFWRVYRADSLWKKAGGAIERGEFLEGLGFLGRYLALKPQDLEGLFLAARTARRAGKMQEAKQLLTRYEDMGGSLQSVRLERDLLLVQQGVIGGADLRLRAMVGPDHPDVTLVLEALARGYMLTERWADARQACSMWRNVDPKAPMAWFWGGWVCERMVQVELAVDFYTKALELAPENREVRIAFARMQLRKRSPETARPHYEWVLQRYPEDEEGLLGLGQCLMEEGKVMEAIAQLDRALAMYPQSNLALALRGRASMEVGEPKQAETWLRGAFRAEPGDAENLHQLVQSLRAQGKSEEAGQLDQKLADLQKDLKRLNELLRMIGPQLADSGPCYEAGVIALRVGRKEQGRNLLEDALRRKGDHRPVHQALAGYYRESGELEKAEVQEALAEKR